MYRSWLSQATADDHIVFNLQKPPELPARKCRTQHWASYQKHAWPGSSAGGRTGPYSQQQWTRLRGTPASPGSSDLILSSCPHRPLLVLLRRVCSPPSFLSYTTATAEVPTGSDCGHCLLSTHSQGKHIGWGVNSHLFYSCCCPSNRNKAREE